MEEIITLLVVDDSGQTRENLRDILSLESAMQVVGEAANGLEALERVAQLHPHVVLMDVNIPGVDGIAATETITTEFPHTSVIVMSAAGDQEYVRRAMVAGARDYLIKPFSSNEVVTAIKRVFDKERRRQRDPSMAPRPAATPSKLITLYSPHDGVGKTTLAANLAVALVEEAKRPTALVDLNLQFGDLDLVLNLEPKRTMADLMPHFHLLDASLMESVLCPHDSGVRLLAAPQGPPYGETLTAYGAQQALRALRESYQYILVDTAPALNDVTLAALDLSDEILLVTNLDVPSLRNAKISLQMMRELHYKIERVKVVVNRSTGEMGLKVAEAEEYLEHPVVARIPSDGRVVVASVNHGIPYVLSHPDARVSESVRALARLLGSPAETTAQEGEPGRKGFAVLLRQLLGVSQA